MQRGISISLFLGLFVGLLGPGTGINELIDQGNCEISFWTAVQGGGRAREAGLLGGALEGMEGKMHTYAEMAGGVGDLGGGAVLWA